MQWLVVSLSFPQAFVHRLHPHIIFYYDSLKCKSTAVCYHSSRIDLHHWIALHFDIFLISNTTHDLKCTSTSCFLSVWARLALCIVSLSVPLHLYLLCTSPLLCISFQFPTFLSPCSPVLKVESLPHGLDTSMRAVWFLYFIWLSQSQFFSLLT